MKLVYKVPKTNYYQNVKEVLKAEFQMSDRLLLKLKKLQRIYLNQNTVYVHHAILPGDMITCDLNDEEDNYNIVPTNMPLSILYEDEAYLIINKPAGDSCDILPWNIIQTAYLTVCVPILIKLA